MSSTEAQAIIDQIEEELELTFWDVSYETMPYSGSGCIDDGMLFRFEQIGNSYWLILGTEFNSDEGYEHPICEFYSGIIGKPCCQVSEWVDLFRSLLYNLDCKGKNDAVHENVIKLLKG